MLFYSVLLHFVSDYPRPVLDNQCVMHDFNELFCNWSLGFPPYKFPERINVTSSFMFSQSTLERYSVAQYRLKQNLEQVPFYHFTKRQNFRLV